MKLARRRIDPRRDVPVLAFVALALTAGVYYLWIGRHNWFYFDEWYFLANRTAGSVHDLLQAHTDEHWSTVPIIVYRTLYNVFGLRTYVPYMAMSIGLHLVIATLLMVVMRRSGVHPWWSTFLAGAFLFFGTGAYNIIWAFQINFNFAVAFGLTQLLLADHDGGFDRRDGFALGAGLLALMSSAPALTMVLAVGVAVLVRRGWRMALAQTAPLGAIYLAWHSHYSATKLHPSVSGVWYYVRNGARAAFEALTGSAVAAALLVVACIVGWVLFVRRDRSALRTRAAAPIGMLAAAPILLAVISLGRYAKFTGPPDAARYVYIFVVLLLPAVALAFDALSRERIAAVVVGVLVVAGLPHNFDAASQFATTESTASGADRVVMTNIVNDPLVHRVPLDLRPDLTGAPAVTIGWLLSVARAGDLPAPWRDTVPTEATNKLRLSLVQRPAQIADAVCARLTYPVTLRLATGDRFQVHAGTVRLVRVPQNYTFPLLFGMLFNNPGTDFVITATTPVVVRISRARLSVRVPSLCLPKRHRTP